MSPYGERGTSAIKRFRNRARPILGLPGAGIAVICIVDPAHLVTRATLLRSTAVA